jgi:hypothetical protein
MRRSRSLSAGLACSLVALALTPRAEAFCRARTCDTTDPQQHCKIDTNLCVTSGYLLHWPTGCVTFDVQQDGSPKLGISATAAAEATTAAFRAWKASDCNGAEPALEVGTFGPVACDESRYNSAGKNANIVMFRDDTWPYQNSIDAYALTTVRFDPETGEIFDADIEVNSAQFPIVADGSTNGVDLQSILTHEVGHFLGMAHAAPSNPDATMRAGWNGMGTDLRTPSADDQAGICDIYPPGTDVPTSCEPRHGFASECDVPVMTETKGCHLGRAPGGEGWLLGGLVLTSFVARRRRRRA